MNAIQALSQLSYTPIGERFLYLIVLEGCICYKPGSQLSYTPTSIFSCKVVEISGIEPLTS